MLNHPRRGTTAKTRAAAQRTKSFHCLAASLLLASGAHAADSLPDWAPKPKPRILEDRFRAEVLVFGAAFDTSFRLDPSPTAQGTPINAEDDLALEGSSFLMLAELTLLPGEHHLVRLNGFSSRRSAQTTLRRTIVFEDDVFFANERVDSTLNLAMFGLTYGYRFIASERSELTASFGIQVAEVEANAVVRSRVLREAENGVAPLPLVGLEGRYDLTNRWSAEARIQYLSAHVGNVEGSIMDARMAITWRTNPYLAIGLGYRTFAVELDSEDRDTRGFVDMKMAGPLLFIRASL